MNKSAEANMAVKIAIKIAQRPRDLDRNDVENIFEALGRYLSAQLIRINA